MKTLISAVFLTLFLTSCSYLNVKKHDPALVSSYIMLKIAVEDVECIFPETIEDALYNSDYVKEYTLFVNDPQKQTIVNIVKDLELALDASIDNSINACNRFIKLTKLKMKSLDKVWSKR